MFTAGIIINLVRTLAYLIAIMYVVNWFFSKANKAYIISFLYLIYKWLIEIFSKDTLWEKITVTGALLIIYGAATFIMDDYLVSYNRYRATNKKQAATTSQKQFDPDDEQWQKTDQAQFEAFLAKQAPLDSKTNGSLKQ